MIRAVRCPSCQLTLAVDDWERPRCSPCNQAVPRLDERNRHGVLIRQRNRAGKVVWQAAATHRLDSLGEPQRARPQPRQIEVLDDLMHVQDLNTMSFGRGAR